MAALSPLDTDVMKQSCSAFCGKPFGMRFWIYIYIYRWDFATLDMVVATLHTTGDASGEVGKARAGGVEVLEREKRCWS